MAIIRSSLAAKVREASFFMRVKVLSFLFAEIPYRKFMFFYSLRNEFLRSENEFHRFLFSKKMNLPEKTFKFSKNG